MSEELARERRQLRAFARAQRRQHLLLVALASGREFEIDEVHVWTVRDGRVVAIRAYVDDAAMLAALS